MGDLPWALLYQGVSIDIMFGEPRPGFGDIFLICGREHPGFPPTGTFGFDRLKDLRFDQVDDYFGVRSFGDEGADVVVWLYPLVNGEPVYHHPGPFDGVRLDYSVLRNPVRHSEFYCRCVEAIASFGVGAVYRSRGVDLRSPPNLSPVREDIKAVVRHWASRGIAVGSERALRIPF